MHHVRGQDDPLAQIFSALSPSLTLFLISATLAELESASARLLAATRLFGPLPPCAPSKPSPPVYQPVKFIHRNVTPEVLLVQD